MKLSTKAAVFKRESLLIGGARPPCPPPFAPALYVRVPPMMEKLFFGGILRLLLVFCYES